MFLETGQRIGRGVVTDPEVRVVEGKTTRRGARLRCDCGTVYEAPLISLIERRGRINTTSCGCARREHIQKVAYRGGAVFGKPRRHGLSNHPLYLSWKQMLRRCEDPRAENYARYGGRGIVVCEQWHDVTVFVADIERLLGARPKGCTLDRINPNGNYGPANVKWSTNVEQARNQETSVRTFACRGCSFELTAVGWLAWWQCPSCGVHNG